MAEYVCEISGKSGHVVLGESERVVRCRDCKHAAPCPLVNSEKLICELLDEMIVNPRDFCAWGEERGA